MMLEKTHLIHVRIVAFVQNKMELQFKVDIEDKVKANQNPLLCTAVYK